VARWKDTGYSEREFRFWIAVAAAGLWALAAILVIDGRLDPRLGFLVVLLGAWIAWRRMRARTAEIEMVVGPDRVSVRDLAAGTPPVHLERSATGRLLAGETGPDWQERLLMLADDAGREVVRMRAGTAAVEFMEPSSATASWWRTHMPPGTSPTSPPRELSVAGLLGAWWPQADRRVSAPGGLRGRVDWKERDLVAFPAWDRRQRRLVGILVAAPLLLLLGVATAGRWSTSEVVAIVPPAVVGVTFGLRLLIAGGERRAGPG